MRRDEPLSLAELAEAFGGFVQPAPGAVEFLDRGAAEVKLPGRRWMRERWLPYALAGDAVVPVVRSGGTGRRPV